MTAKKAKLIPALARIDTPREPTRAQKARQRRLIDAWRNKTTATPRRQERNG